MQKCNGFFSSLIFFPPSLFQRIRWQYSNDGLLLLQQQSFGTPKMLFRMWLPCHVKNTRTSEYLLNSVHCLTNPGASVRSLTQLVTLVSFWQNCVKIWQILTALSLLSIFWVFLSESSHLLGLAAHNVWKQVNPWEWRGRHWKLNSKSWKLYNSNGHTQTIEI